MKPPDWIRIDDEENTIYGFPLSPSFEVFNILLFGTVLGDYVNLCHSVEYEFEIIQSVTSIESLLESETIPNKNNEGSREVQVLTIGLPVSYDLLDIGEVLSAELNLPLQFLQILPENNNYHLYKQLHSLNVIASSGRVRLLSAPIENEFIFSWLIPRDRNISAILHVLGNPPLRQQHSRKRRDTQMWDWHVVRGRVRICLLYTSPSPRDS